MNRRLIFSNSQDKTFELQHDRNGYRLLHVISENEAKAVTGYYANAGELVEGLTHFCLFTGEDAVSLQEISQSIKDIARSIKDYLTEHCGSWG